MHFICGKNSGKLKNSQAEAIDIYLHLFHSIHYRKKQCVDINLKYNMRTYEIRVIRSGAISLLFARDIAFTYVIDMCRILQISSTFQLA